MGKAKELARILNDQYRPRDQREEALDGLINLHTKEAIEIIGEFERDQYGSPSLRDKARDYLAGKRKK